MTTAVTGLPHCYTQHDRSRCDRGACPWPHRPTISFISTVLKSNVLAAESSVSTYSSSSSIYYYYYCYMTINTVRDVWNFGSGFQKNSDSVWNEDLLWLKKCVSVRISQLFTTCVITKWLTYSKHYSDSGQHDFDVTDITHNNNDM